MHYSDFSIIFMNPLKYVQKSNRKLRFFSAFFLFDNSWRARFPNIINVLNAFSVCFHIDSICFENFYVGFSSIQTKRNCFLCYRKSVLFYFVAFILQTQSMLVLIRSYINIERNTSNR